MKEPDKLTQFYLDETKRFIEEIFAMTKEIKCRELKWWDYRAR